MKKSVPTKLIRNRITSLAKEYRDKGYTVRISPSKEQLPDALRSFQPDMIAKKGREAIVFEVKTRYDVVTEKAILRLAKAVNSLGDWTFTLVLVGSREPIQGLKGIDVADLRRIGRRIASAQRVLKSGDPDSALLIAWSAMEAVLRNIARAEGIESDKYPSVALPKELYSLGLINHRDFRLLTEGYEYRNAIAHGFTTLGLTSKFVVRFFSGIIRLMKRIEQTEKSGTSN